MYLYLIVIGLFVIGFVLMAAALHFSKFKRRPQSGCCGGGHCSTDNENGDSNSCYASKSEFVKNYKKSAV